MRGKYWRSLAAALGIAAAAGGAAGQPQVDPDWPCIQRKVPELSIGQMWAGPAPADGWAPDPELRELARRLAPRRVPIAEIESAATDLAAGLAPDERSARLSELFALVLRQINTERGQIMTGIARYAHRQVAFSGQIEAMQSELTELQAAPEDEKDWDRIEELEDTLAWETRIFKERAQSLTYVCETPVLLEQRAFAIARALATVQ